MKIEINRIPYEGLVLEETVPPSELELETETVKFRKPIKVKADISKITNTASVNLSVDTSMYSVCSRCLKEFEFDFKKNLKLNYLVNKSELVIDLNPDIRQEIILEYPLKPLCNPLCKGLCPKCGKNLNEGDCSCGIT